MAALGVAALITLPGSPARAQAAAAPALVGTVRDAVTGGIVPGVVVTLFGPRDSVVGRSVTDLRGFAIAVPPGTSRIQFRRIGYSPVELPLTKVAPGPLDVTMRRNPVQLDRVVTSASRDKACEDGRDRPEALALWNEVRSGMLAAHLAREISAHVTMLSYERLPVRGGTQSVTRSEGDSVARAFGAVASASDLARSGYIVLSGSEQVYFAPDERVLADEAFLDTHCFTEVRRNARDSTLTVRFSPLRARRTIDISGEVVLGQDPLELRSVAFRYSGLPRELTALRPGGTLQLRPMPNGITMVHQWEIRAVTSGATASTGPSRTDALRPQVVTPESGSLIERIEFAGYEPWVARFPDVTGTLRVRDQPETFNGLELFLESTPYRAVVDSAGGYRISGVLPGTYGLLLRDTVHGPYGLSRVLQKRVEVKAEGARVEPLEIEPLAAAISRLCRQDGKFNPPFPDVRGQGVILARVDFGGLTPVELPFTAMLLPDTRVVGSTTKTATGVTRRDGYLRLCNFPVRRQVMLSITTPSGALAEVTIDVPDDQPRLVTLYPRPGG